MNEYERNNGYIEYFKVLNKKGLLGKEINYELQNLSTRLRNDNNIVMPEFQQHYC